MNPKSERLSDLARRLEIDISRSSPELGIAVELGGGNRDELTVTRRLQRLVTLWIDDDEPDGDQLLGLIGGVQDAVVEELKAPWPACPVHGDWLQISTASDGAFVWRCEVEPDIEYALGEFPSLH